MRSTSKRLAARLEHGAALVWIAGSMVLLLTMAAFATDLGWILLWNSRLQSAADSSALAGVTNIPALSPTPDAVQAAQANGFTVGANATMTDAVLADNSYRVTLDTDIDTFFLRLIGFDTFHLSQTATAQYVKPVRLGSPGNTFGGPASNFWAAINARYTEIQQGDPYASQCITHSNFSHGCSGQTNPEYRPGGYYYGVEIGPGSSGLHIDIYDGGHYVQGFGSYGNGTSDPGDTSWRWNWPSPERGVYLEYELFPPDATPTDPTDNKANNGNINTCTGSSSSTTFPVNGASAAGHFESWGGANNCSIGGSLTPGIWVLQLPSPLYEGSTKFGLRARVDSGPAPRIYGILDMSLYVNFDGNSAEPYLAEIREEHAGKILEVDIWDLGDVDGDAEIRFVDPIGGSINPPDCTWTSTNGESDNTPEPCVIDISDQRFNAEWLHVKIPLGDPLCNPALGSLECWWKLYIYSEGQAHDRTTWAARVAGDPVRLVN